jgi:hypothetical protein
MHANSTDQMRFVFMCFKRLEDNAFTSLNPATLLEAPSN